MGRKKPVVVIPLDGSRPSTNALGAAQAITKIVHGMLYIVYVAESHIPKDQLAERLKISGEDLGQCLIEQIVGEPVEAITSFASKVGAKMIVMASHGHTSNHSRLVGNITMGVVQNADTPVIVIRSDMKNPPTTDWKPRKMLCPLDGSPMASAQMQWIFDLAKLLGVEVDVLNVAVHGDRTPKTGTITTHEYEDYPQYDLPAWVDEFVRRCCEARPPEVELSMFQLAGEPVKTMIDFSKEHGHDLIVLTWHGTMDENRAQTVKGLLKDTEVPVLLTKANTE
jgi:nucleotide-binding universal stress UspA family protein